MEKELQKARENDDEAAVGRIEGEKHEITTQLAADSGLGGRSREFSSPIEKGRSSAYGALGRAYEKLRQARPSPMSKLADHFKVNISCQGSAFMYNPKNVPAWAFDFISPPEIPSESRET